MISRGFPYLLNKMKTIIAFGNPLLDTTVFINDNLLLNKYNLKDDDQKEITEKVIKELSYDISGYKKYYSAGGCAQNSLRVLQWLVKKKCRTIIFGSVGKDNEAEVLKQLIENDGVETRYIEQENLPTGKTISLVKGQNRSLVAYIGAAEKLPLNDLLNKEDFVSFLEESDFVYIEGYFLTNRIDAAKYILEYCNKHNKKIIFNICGKYVCDLYPKDVQHFVENSDIVFGNKREFEALVQIMGLKDTDELLKRLMVNNGNGKYHMEHEKIIVITDGSNPGLCIYEGGKIEGFNVHPIKKNDIRDTTAAGDAFAGGFIAGLCKNKSIKDCTNIGCYSAFHIIKQVGCTLPDFQPDILDF